VIDASGDAAVYHYDAVGNLLSITRSTPTQVNVIEFTPDAGPVGQSVTIYGTGFSATANQNTVTFNGTTASITSAATTQLVVTVPGGATTGTIAVTSPNGSDTSSTSFTVTTAVGAPTITSFTPTSAVAGTSITVTGTNFDSVTATNNQSRFNVSLAAPSGSTSTTVTASVPAGTGSGRITVKTPAGSAVSTDDLIVPPPPYVANDVASASRLSFASATTVTISTASKIALRLFDGTQGQRVSLLGTNGMTGQVIGCDVTVTLLSPFVAPLSAGCMESSGFLDMRTLPAAGTYSILVDPASTATGSVTLTLYDVPADYTSTITPGGSAVTATMSTPGQNGKLTFSGTSGQRISVLGTNGMTGQVSLVCDVNVTVWKPDAGILTGPACMEGSGFIDVTTLPATGTYTIVVDPTSLATGNLTLTVYDVPADYSNTITAGGSAVTASMPTPGQNGTLTFSGTSGQRISLKGTNGLTGYVLGCDVNVKILKPDATVLAANTCMEGSGFIDTQTLPSTGTYTIVVDPVNHAVGNVTLTLYTVPADTTGTVTIGGSAVGVTLSTPGQNGTLTFSGTASQQVTVRMTSNTYGWVTVRLKKPDGSVLTSLLGFGSFNLSTQTLPTTGTYTIEVDPSAAATGSINVAVTSP
jgi:IPT/TIG domain